MKLEEEIHQKSFKSEHQKLVVNLLFTHGWLASHYKKLFKNNDITTPQYNILRILRGQYPNPVSINLLKERMLDKMSDTSRLIERLRVKGLVNRKVCNNDRRKSDVKISEKGLMIVNGMDYLDKEIDNTLSNLSHEEAKTINDLLDKMRV